MDQIIAIGENYRYLGDIKALKIGQNTKTITSINLHGNNINKITHLDMCYSLADLDLSSNQIQVVEGLESCEGLKRLNLSCNRLRRLSGLNFLYNLVTLNLSYNKIENIKNLSHFSGEQFHLENLLLHGNELKSVPVSIGILKKIRTLKTMSIHSNPLCENKNYKRVISNCMPNLLTIDDTDVKEESFSSASTDTLVTTQLVKTPFIDKALKHYQNPDIGTDNTPQNESKTSSSSSPSSSEKSEIAPPNPAVDYSELIKQVLSILKDEQQPVRLPKEQTESPEVVVERESREEVSKPVDLDSLYSTNKLLLAELEAERERRWKSEKHIVELSDKLTKNKQSLRSYEELNASSEAGINGIRDMLALEHSQKIKLANLLEAFKEKHKDVISHLSQKERCIKQRESEIFDLKAKIDLMKKASADNQKNQKLQLQSSKQEAQVQRKQCELLRHELKEHQAQVKSLQQLIVAREQEHLKEKQGLVSINGDEVQQKIREVLKNEKEKFDLSNKNLIDSLEQCQLRYQKLEKEFRVALYLENKRYEELHSAFTKVSSQLSHNKVQLSQLKDGDDKNVALIKKLKISVEEQSSYIEQFRRSKKEETDATMIRITVLEKELEDSIRKVLELSSLKAQNDHLKAENCAQVSVIDGLRAERGLWSKELAQQGAELSQDRGKLQNEIQNLSRQLNENIATVATCKDALRIKECQLTDAMDTINKLKQAIVETELQCEEKLQHLQVTISEGTEQVELSEDRMEAVREVLKQTEVEREEALECVERQSQDINKLKTSYKELKLQWKEKVEMLNQLESSIQQVTSLHNDQQSSLQMKLEESKIRISQTQASLEEQKCSYEAELKKQAAEHLTKLHSQKEEQATMTQSLKNQIQTLETEMRLLLHQTQQQKKDNEAKMSRLAGALGEFTQFLKPDKLC